MTPPSLPLLRRFPGDSPLSRAVAEIRDFLQSVLGLHRLWGNRVEVTFTGTGTVPVAHGLQRQWQGYWIEGRTADIRVYDGVVPTSGALPPETHVYLRSTGAGTARLFVF